MVAAVDPYIDWMNTTAGKAGYTAAQASAAATAYEAAYAMTVPPVAVAANRAQLAMLVATNVLGQNTAAIAANEAHYGEMWAQDAAAMYGYAGSSASATTVQALTPPPETANPAAAAQQSSAVSASAGAGAQAQLQQVISSVPSSLNQLTSPLSAATNAATQPTGFLGQFLDFLDGADGNPFGTFLNSSLVNGVVSGSYISPAIVTPAITSGIADINSLGPGAAAAGGAGVTGMITPQPLAPVQRGRAERGRLGEHLRQHTGRQAVRSADVDGGRAGSQPQRRDVCRWRVDQCGGPDRRRYRGRPGRYAGDAGRGSWQVRRIRSRSPLRKPPNRDGPPAVRRLIAVRQRRSSSASR